MRILITGGAGFIGSHLCRKLMNDNEVIVLDNFFTGSKKNVPQDIEIIRHDVRFPYKIECDWIFNLACPASPVAYQFNPIRTINTSIMGAINCLELALEMKGKPTILQASTSEVYGNPAEHPQKEDYWGNVNPVGIRSCYDEGKRCAETLFMDYHREFGIDTRIVRIFNTYGPYMASNDGRVISNFIVQALNGDDITIYGDGSQSRSFQYVDDLIEGILIVMDSGISTPINIGNPNEYTIKELAQSIIELTNSKSQIIYKPLPDDDPIRRKPDISIMKCLGWTPKIDLTEGLRKTIDYFKSINDYLPYS